MTRTLIFLSLLFFNIYSYGCICEYISLEKEIELSDEIFLGRLIEVKEIDYTINDFDLEETTSNIKTTKVWYAKFEVEKKWKGSNKKYIEIYQTANGCNVLFNVSLRSYIVFAKKEKVFSLTDKRNQKEVLTTPFCSRTKEFLYHIKSKKSTEKNQLNEDFYKLNKQFPNEIKLHESISFKWKCILYGFMIFLIGLFIGTKLKSIKKY